MELPPRRWLARCLAATSSGRNESGSPVSLRREPGKAEARDANTRHRPVPFSLTAYSPVFLRNGHGGSERVPVRSSSANGLGEHWISTLEPMGSRAEYENGGGLITDGAATPGSPAAAPTRKPTFLQKERWKAIQKARRKGMSLRAIERELGIHRATIKKYTDAEGPPTRQSPVVSSTSSSDTIEA